MRLSLESSLQPSLVTSSGTHTPKTGPDKSPPAQRPLKQVHPQHEGTTTVDTEITQESTKNLSQAEKVKQGVSAVFSPEQLATPHAQILLEIMDSPEFTAFIERDHYTSLEFYEFLESQGYPDVSKLIMREFEEYFQEAFPGETPESVLPQMRQTLYHLMEENDMDYAQVVFDFVSDPIYAVWGSVYFQTDTDAFVNWTVDTLRDYDISATDTSEGVETAAPVPSTEDERIDTSFVDDLSIDDHATETSQPPPSSTAPPLPENNALITEEFDIETEIKKLIEQTAGEVPEAFPTEASFEKALRDAFAPQRINTALQTLKRYGPEEGLRRLQRSDPEVATHLEQLF